MRTNLPVTQREYQFPVEQSLVSVTDLKGRIVYCNPTFVDVSGYSRAELMGQPHNLLRHPDMPAEAFRDMWETIEGGRPWSAPVKNRRKNGDHYWVQAQAVPMRDGERTVGYLSVRTAVSRDEVAQAEALYARMRDEAAAGRLRTGLHRGRLVRRDLPGRVLQSLRALPALLGWDSLLMAAAVCGAGAAATWLAPAAWLPLALLLVAVAQGAGRRLRQGALQRVLRDALRLSSGDLAFRVETGHPGVAGELQVALSQLAVNLRTVIADARTEIENVRGGASEIAAGSRELSSRTEAQAASLEETAASMEQINSTVKHSAAGASEGAQLAAEAARVAQHSHDGVMGVVHAMEGITDSSRRIAEIIQVIEGVAFQTNILALNAAVEAARAGESGRGFAVVAAEVRTLAQRTAEAAREIRRLISESGERVAAGSRHTEVARERMGEALQSVGKVNQLLEQISHAAVEQQGGVSQINQAITELDSITQQNAAMVEQLSAAAGSLDDQVSEVTNSMRMFRLRAGDATVADADAVALRREAKAVGAAEQAFDLHGAIAKHQQWKTTLRNAALRNEKLDADKISCDDVCPLGQWLHGAGRGQWSGRPAFTDLLQKHASFHLEAGKVARVVNAGRHEESLQMLESGTPFAQSTQATVLALRKLMLEVEKPAHPARQAAAARPAAAATAVATASHEDDWTTF